MGNMFEGPKKILKNTLLAGMTAAGVFSHTGATAQAPSAPHWPGPVGPNGTAWEARNKDSVGVYESDKFKVADHYYLGGVENTKAVIEVAKGKASTNEARAMLSHLTLSETREKVYVQKISVQELGLRDGATYEEICHEAKSRGLRMCRAEIGVQVILLSKTLPEGGPYAHFRVFIAMKPTTVGKEIFIFTGGHDKPDPKTNPNGNWLGSQDVTGQSHYSFRSGDVFIFEQAQ